MVLLSDAFPYIWHKRLLAGEMQRVATGDGVIVMPHLHSAHGDNYSAGDTLSPAAYQDLFAPLAPRLFDDRMLLEGVLEDRVVDLANHASPAACGEPSENRQVECWRARSLRRRRFAARNGSSAHDLSHVSGQRRRSAARGRFSVVGGQRAKFGPRGPQGPPETATRVDLSPLRAS